MKCLGVLAAMLVLLGGVPQRACSQDPVIDLAVTNINYTSVSPESANVEAEIQLATADSIGSVLTDVRFYLDGIPVGSVVYDVTPTAPGPCELLGPPCEGYCAPANINGNWTEGFCAQFQKPNIEPPLYYCVCVYLTLKPMIAGKPTGEPVTCTATVDYDDAVEETDESNNSMTIFVGPTATNGTSWGLLKSLYR
jgi:hypothetical protein